MLMQVLFIITFFFLEIVYISNINEVMVGVSGFQFQLKKNETVYGFVLWVGR